MRHLIYFRTVYEVWGLTVKVQCSTLLPLVVGHGAIFYSLYSHGPCFPFPTFVIYA